MIGFVVRVVAMAIAALVVGVGAGLAGDLAGATMVADQGVTMEECRALQIGTREEVVVLPDACDAYAVDGIVVVDGMEFDSVPVEGGRHSLVGCSILTSVPGTLQGAGPSCFVHYLASDSL